MGALRRSLLLHANRWPVTATVTLGTAVVLAAWLLPAAHFRWRAAGLSSGERARQAASIAWARSSDEAAGHVIAHADAFLREAKPSITFRQLVELLQDLGAWDRATVGPDAWMRWTQDFTSSGDPALQRFAVERLLDAADSKQSADPWYPLGRRFADDALSQLARLIESEHETIRRGAWLAAHAWDTKNPPAGPPVFDRAVIRDSATGALDPPVGLSAKQRRLWMIEQGHIPAGTSSVAVDDLSALEQTLLVRLLPAEGRLDALIPLLTHEEPWTRAIACTVAASSLPLDQARRVAVELTRRVDATEREAGWLILNLIHDRLASEETAKLSQSTRIVRGINRTAPLLRDLFERSGCAIAPLAGNFRHRYEAALEHKGFAYPTLLVGLLGARERAGWDHVLGPFGLSDDELITLLDHYRFAWVLDALMPAPETGAPRFPLWVDRETQLEAVAALRVWYVRHRAAWTHD